MPATGLKFPTCRGQRAIKVLLPFSEFPFPITNPSFNVEMQIPRCTEAMQMVRHQEIIADQPGRRFLPNLMNQFMHCRIGQPWFPILGVDVEENKVTATDVDVDTSRGVMPLREEIVRFVSQCV